MPYVHPTAIVLGEVDLADDVGIGPGCVIDGTLGRIIVGSGTHLVGNVWLIGPLTIGHGNTIYPFACLGFAPQSLGYDHAHPGKGLSIGDHNTFREGATIHRAMTDEGPTTIGSHNYFMTNTHAGHDTHVADHCTFASGMLLAGHVIVDEWVTIGGNTTIHQFVRIGRGAMLTGSAGATRDLPPFFMLTGINVAGSLNMVGMRRQGLSHEQIEDVRWVYKTLYRRKLSPPTALEALRERADSPMVAEYIAFIESSKRGLTRGHGHPKRSREH
jgi:UDP-N-acetylglucosamine acyltransferase